MPIERLTDPPITYALEHYISLERSSKPREFDPFVSAVPLFIPTLVWKDPFTGMEMYSTPGKIPINALSMKCRRAIANGSVWYLGEPCQNMKLW